MGRLQRGGSGSVFQIGKMRAGQGVFFLSVVCVCLLYWAVISQRSMVRVKIAPKKVEKNKIKYENKTVGMMLAAQPWT